MAKSRKPSGKNTASAKGGRGGNVFLWSLWSLNWLLTLWCSGAIWFQRGLPAPAVKGTVLGFFLILALFFQFRSVRNKRWLIGSYLLAAAVVTAWLTLLHPTGKQDWDPPFIKMPTARFSADGNSVTIENIRDFHYRSEHDYDIRYRTDTYRFDEITAMDYSITHWNGSELFGHIMLSFTFKDGRRLVISPEARLERGEIYELLPGFYRWYELIFIVATEEDVFQLRTHHRRYEQEEVLLYPTNTQPEIAAYLLRDLLERGNRLAEHPEFYNGLFYNCLSSMAPTAEKLGFDFCTGLRGTFNGLSDYTGYRTGWLRRDWADQEFREYKKRHSVNQYVEHLVDPPDYSQRIRPYLQKR